MAAGSSRQRLLVSGQLHEKGMALLRQKAEVDVRPSLSQEELLAVIGDYDGLVVDGQAQVTGQVVEYGYRLRAIASTAPGLDNIDVSAARSQGVEVVNVPAVDAVAIAEHTIRLMLALSGRDENGGRSAYQGLSGKTLGVVGFGRIGRQLAQRALAFDMRVMVNQPRLTPELALAAGVDVAGLPRLLRTADFVSLHVPYSGATETLIGAAELRQMKPSAFLLNMANTELVDHAALLAALNEGRIQGAAVARYTPHPAGEGGQAALAVQAHPKVIAARHISSFQR
ncbi:MAG: NAD(P)-dependent oxidoreductase, partial [Candidatus Promineifilaceae bacterium]